MTADYYTNGLVQVKAYRTLQTRVVGVVKGYDFGTVSEWFVLSHVYYGQKVMAKDLAALLEVEAPLITRLVGNLVKRDLVSISPHESDKRAKFVSPTKRAGVVVPQVQEAIRAAISQLLSGVSDEELAAYGKVLETIIVNGEKS